MRRLCIILAVFLSSFNHLGQSEESISDFPKLRFRIGAGFLLQNNRLTFTSEDVYLKSFRQFGLTYNIRAEAHLNKKFTTGINYLYTSHFIKASTLQTRLETLNPNYFIQSDSVISSRDIFTFGPFIAYNIPVFNALTIQPSAGISLGWLTQSTFRHAYKSYETNYFYTEEFQLQSSFVLQQSLGFLIENSKNNEMSTFLSIAGIEIMACHTGLRGTYSIFRKDVHNHSETTNHSFQTSGMSYKFTLILNILKAYPLRVGKQI